MAGCTTCNDLTRRFDRIEKDLKILLDATEDIYRNQRKVSANIDELNIHLGKGKIDWIGLTAAIMSTVSAVAAILNVIQIWAQGAYFSKLIDFSQKILYQTTLANYKLDQVVAKDLNDILYASNQANIKLNNQKAFLDSFYKVFFDFGTVVYQNLAYQNNLLNQLFNELRKIPSLIQTGFNTVTSQIGGELSKISQITNNATNTIIREIGSIRDRPVDLDPSTKNEVFTLRGKITEIQQQQTRQTSETTDIKRITLSKSSTNTNTQKDYSPALDGISKKLADLAALVAPFPAALNGLNSKVDKIPQNTLNNPDFIPKVSAGVCKTTAPGGCMNRALNDLGNDIGNDLNRNNKNLLDKINTGANAAQLGYLQRLDTNMGQVLSRLGNQLPGGLSGKLTRLSNWLKLPQIINVLTLITVLHNASALSVNLIQTLGDILSLGLSVIGIKDEDGSPININAILGKEAEEFIISIVGSENWAGIKANTAKGMAIWRATANIIDTARSIGDSVGNIARVAVENSGKIGNALTKDRVISEDTLPPMSENVPVYFAGYTNAINNLDDAASAIQGVLSEVNNIQESAAQIEEQKQVLNTALEQAQPKPKIENIPIKEERTASLAASKADEVDADTDTSFGRTDADS